MEYELLLGSVGFMLGDNLGLFLDANDSYVHAPVINTLEADSIIRVCMYPKIYVSYA
jgi:hypothetical protein